MTYWTVTCMARRDLCHKPIVCACLQYAETEVDAEAGVRDHFGINDSWRYYHILARPYPQSWPGNAKILDPLPVPVALA